MPHRPDTPCNMCGKYMWSGPGSLPPEERRCRACRASARAVRRTITAPCEMCGGDFAPYRRRGGRTRTCSVACGQVLLRKGRTPEESAEARRQALQAKCRRRRALRRGATSEPYTLTEIAERDGHRCGLCRRKVKMTLRPPDPRSPAVDHIVPLSRGGDDVRANVQLAHMGCNSAKGNRGSQQLVLVG